MGNKSTDVITGPWTCLCGAIYKAEHNLQAHVKAMEERNSTLPETPAKDDVNKREKHGIVK